MASISDMTSAGVPGRSGIDDDAEAAGILDASAGYSPHEVALPGTLIGPGVVARPPAPELATVATAEVDVLGHGQLDRHARPTVGNTQKVCAGGRPLFPRPSSAGRPGRHESVTERPVGGSDPAAAQ